MAQKKVFKGVINGVEFDNVADYNMVMNKLVEDGADINASSQTMIENIEETRNLDENLDHSCNGCDIREGHLACCNPQPIIRMLHGFDTPDHYLDVNVSHNMDDNKKLYDTLVNELDETYDLVNDKLNDMDEAALSNYRDDVRKIIDHINIDAKKTQEVINSYNDKINVLEACKPVMDAYNAFYTDILDRIDEVLSDKRTINDSSHDHKLCIKDLIREIFGV